ncbi:MAG TPA: cupin domain-containing protein [Planctomycetota bacterium]|nr:cupin domain-containing protein [Planctomycetota bacterium]
MNRFSNLSLVASGFVLGLVPFMVAAQKEGSAQKEQPKPMKITGTTLMPAADLKWVPMPGLEGATQCALWGDSTKEAHRIFYKWPAGTKAPLHTHTAGDRGVVVSGTLGLAVDGAAVKKLPPGSYFSLAAGTKHATSVEGDAACVFYIEREGPFDAVFVDEAGKKQ